jgi:exosortase/archaeosortase family protein
LRFTGVDIVRSGTKMLMMVPNHVTGQEETRTLNVAEACAGLRSLMTFVTVAAAVAFLSARPLWQKLIIVALAVPIAIFCNVMRVSGQGLLDRYVSQKLAEGFAHQFVGVVMLVPAFLLILLVCWMLDHLFIDEVDEYERQRLRMSGGRAAEKKIIQIQRPAAVAAGAVAPAAAAAPVAPRPAVVPPPKPTGFPRPAGNVGPVARTAPKPVAPGQGPAPKPPAPAQVKPQAPAQPNAKPQAAKPAGPAPVQPAPQQRGGQS